MPTIEISLKDFNSVMKKNFSLKELGEALLYVKGEINAVSEDKDKIKVDLKDTNRPDLWSTEGIARELKAQYGIEKGLPSYNVKPSGRKAFVDSALEGIRPKAAYAIVKGVKVNDFMLAQLIQLQEKICESFGRKRKEIAIGVFDLDKVKGNVKYFAAEPSLEFIPLGSNERMSLREILLKHPKGKEFGHLIENFAKFPLLVDSGNEVLSMPPIINSEGSGKVTEETRNLFVDVTGFNQKLVEIALKIMCLALADRGGKIESIKIVYEGKKQKIVTPKFGAEKISFALGEIEKILGQEFKEKEILSLLEKKRMKGKIKGKSIKVFCPDYRADILHSIDVIEDIAIAFDFNKFIPEKVLLPTRGSGLSESGKFEALRELCVGLGMQEILSFHLTSRDIQEHKMNLKELNFIELSNPVSSSFSVFRLSLIPEALNFLGRNKHCPFPQRIFELGRAVELNEKTETRVKEPFKLCLAFSHSKSNFNEMKSVLEAIAKNLSFNYELKEAIHPSLTEGRVAEILVEKKMKGLIGEVNQKTLNNFGLEANTTVMELEL
ncbi:MAG: phenylalanine--tRNA ligase subunit beta [Candidatus Diapherotrites archaeon]